MCKQDRYRGYGLQYLHTTVPSCLEKKGKGDRSFLMRRALGSWHLCSSTWPIWGKTLWAMWSFANHLPEDAIKGKQHNNIYPKSISFGKEIWCGVILISLYCLREEVWDVQTAVGLMARVLQETGIWKAASHHFFAYQTGCWGVCGCHSIIVLWRCVPGNVTEQDIWATWERYSCLLLLSPDLWLPHVSAWLKRRKFDFFISSWKSYWLSNGGKKVSYPSHIVDSLLCPLQLVNQNIAVFVSFDIACQSPNRTAQNFWSLVCY